jgi:orotidine-5'-phosphate decarboxylase
MNKLPSHLKYEKNPFIIFNQEIIEATQDLAIAYKANMAFYECEGQNGLEALNDLGTRIPQNVLLLLDGKRGDVPHTAKMYASGYFKQFGANAVTVNPYMGKDSITPFIKDPEKGAFILSLTSNEGSMDFQHLQIGLDPLYLYVGKKVQSWNNSKNCGLVVSAKDIEGMKILRGALPDLPFLVPGVGTQGGVFADVVKFGRDKNGTGLLINIGRDIIYAGDGKDFAQKVRERAKYYVDEMASIIHTSWNY